MPWHPCIMAAEAAVCRACLLAPRFMPPPTSQHTPLIHSQRICYALSPTHTPQHNTRHSSRPPQPPRPPPAAAQPVQGWPDSTEAPLELAQLQAPNASLDLRPLVARLQGEAACSAQLQGCSLRQLLDWVYAGVQLEAAAGVVPGGGSSSSNSMGQSVGAAGR